MVEQAPKRLTEYPSRFRARLAGRVIQVTLPASGANPRYEAVVEVEKSRPLPPSSSHQLTGIPIVEVLDDDVEPVDISAGSDDDDDEDQDSAGNDEDQDASVAFPQYRVYTPRPKSPPPLYPTYPPLNPGDRVTLIWHGQKDVPGIVAGTYIRCSGMLTVSPMPARIYNPRYEIVPLRLIRHRGHQKFQKSQGL
ncbi:asparaginase [uncultured Rothia sp.]|uniref:asparaginase n=1 Tax=uncultured Rothia sp. TaxID=316088 RepID=UPI00321648BA